MEETIKENCNTLTMTKDFIKVSSNWMIDRNKNYVDTITTIPLLLAPESIDLDDIISLDTCIYLRSEEKVTEPCTLDIKITNNQKISRIIVLSEAYVLEFFKQYGEYATTVFAEFVDEFKGSNIYLAELNFKHPTTEASIKFTKIKNTEPILWIFGIKLVLTESTEENESEILDYTITNFLNNLNGSVQQKAAIANIMLESVKQDKNTINDEILPLRNLMTIISNNSKVQNNHKNKIEESKKADLNSKDDCTKNIEITDNIETYINNKFHEMEERTMRRLNEIEHNINEKLNVILEKLEIKLK
ncbi:PREDICTED: uncharacterized protein LOC107066021 [Polistes dominula]|uniref:Uncharacterized protein LOC107066021 n=1 Tax=Polistes dominula TaxID=743375 RepID=A0ABM1I677_POLDO|nr:PREDICTED: uncharacterized protein LOC107066021 [Polistes dominula]XP_015175715.1 PREDICTED: uncharacterized protein LOC107066021 [Polistes dominula]XP_015175716.1 PREDICTED: uncharacterized protein LOC107066021 [Polistes dominula]XP_015175717.1 PREDICTED: uncharacterized protein LOC107066021 [Polistes dominula]XP_015175718.1 PREDICTED: uncharacterized protein LOC107066021 [Polistes dominula]